MKIKTDKQAIALAVKALENLSSSCTGVEYLDGEKLNEAEYQMMLATRTMRSAVNCLDNAGVDEATIAQFRLEANLILGDANAPFAV